MSNKSYDKWKEVANIIIKLIVKIVSCAEKMW